MKFLKKSVDNLEIVGYTLSCVRENRKVNTAGCGSAWLERLVWDQEAAGSNPVTPIVTNHAGVVQW